MGHTNDTTIQVQVVKGGFIMTTYGGLGDAETEVFSSPGKLLKAFRAVIEGPAEKTESSVDQKDADEA